MKLADVKIYLKDKTNITPRILGQMLLFEEANATRTYKMGKVEYTVNDKYIMECLNYIAQNTSEPNWLDYKVYIALVNNLRFCSQVATTRLRECEIDIEHLIKLYQSVTLSAFKKIETAKPELAFILDCVQRVSNVYYGMPDDEIIKEFDCIHRHLLSRLRYLVAYNKYIDLIAKQEDIKELRGYKQDLKGVSTLLNALNKITEDKEVLSVKHNIDDYILNCLPILDLSFEGITLERKHITMATKELSDLRVFLEYSERVDDYIVRLLANGVY